MPTGRHGDDRSHGGAALAFRERADVMHTMRKWASCAVAATIVLAPTRNAGAQSESDLAKASQNPVANLVSLPLQFNYYTGGGLGSKTSLILNVQPVLPLALDSRWMLVSRTVIPYVNIPTPAVVRSTGIADIQEQMYFTPRHAGSFVWGAGPLLSIPTATNDLVRTGQWALGPNAVGLVTRDRWVIGALASNIWRIGGVNNGAAINQFTIQPFVNFNIPSGWSIVTAPLITSNWSAADDDRWTVPIGIGIAKVTAIGRQPVSVGAQYYHAVAHPDNAGANQFRFQFTMLYPVEQKKRAVAER
jgi:hypothetical protein